MGFCRSIYAECCYPEIGLDTCLRWRILDRRMALVDGRQPFVLPLGFRRIPVPVGSGGESGDEAAGGSAIPRLSLMNLTWGHGALAISKDRAVFGQGELIGNLWMTRVSER